MKKLVVVDFDKTLLPYDSLRYYVLLRIKRGDVAVLCYAFFRKIRVLSKKRFSCLIDKHFSENSVAGLVEKFSLDIDKDVLSRILNYVDDDTQIVLLSASPTIYVEKIALKLGFIGYGSYYCDGEYFYLHGTNKQKFILEKYKKEEYRYVYSIADNKSDLPLLWLFEKYDLINS